METKLSVSIDPTLAQWAREFASQEGLSLSRLVAIGLRRVKQEGRVYFAEKWRGRLKLRKRLGDPRMEYLLEKYGGDD